MSHATRTIQALETQKIQLQPPKEQDPNAPEPMKAKRSSRWDTGADGSQRVHVPQMSLPDLSRPPPGFMTDDKALIPKLPYHQLPAGLMVPLVDLDDSEYKPLNPKNIRLPPPTPPTEKLLAALELFYLPPSHERPRDSEGWEMIGLYEWQRDKNDAVKKKQEDIESGERRLTPDSSPDPYAEEEEYVQAEAEKERNTKKEISVVEAAVVEDAVEKSNKKKKFNEFDEKTRRSKTRSRSRSLTPDRGRRRRSSSRSASPEYSMPSYLTRRSPTPPTETASMEMRLSSSNKGHQMMERMGWKAGSGLGSAESGITEPISGGEVRDRQDQFKGVGIGQDPFEAFRKQRSGSFHTRMRDRDREREKKKKDGKKSN